MRKEKGERTVRGVIAFKVLRPVIACYGLLLPVMACLLVMVCYYLSGFPSL